MQESVDAVRFGSFAGRTLQSAVSGTRSLAEGLFAAFFPSDCRLCGSPLTNISRLPVCPGCIQAIEPIAGATCSRCGESLLRIGDDAAPELCGQCQGGRPAYEKAVAYGAYDGGLRELIHLLKYEQVTPAAAVLGGMLAQAIAKLRLEGAIVVVPVPLHRSKRRQRGFNQSELIVRTALKKLPELHATLDPKVLERVRATVSQIGLTRPQRKENLRGAFRVAHPSTVKGTSVLLVDDVFTTGTTISECARVLRRAGAEHVWIATVARTLKNHSSPLQVEELNAVGMGT